MLLADKIGWSDKKCELFFCIKFDELEIWYVNISFVKAQFVFLERAS